MIALYCGHSISVEALIQSGIWAAKQQQWDILQWNYYRCPTCNYPGWFGFDEGGKFHVGMFGAAPVADLIPLEPIDIEIRYKLEPDRIILHYANVDYPIPAGSSYW